MYRKTQLTELVCLRCGNITSIYRQKCHLRTYGHIKDLWCYKCKDTTKHYEILERHAFIHKEFEDELSQYVKELIYPNQEDNNYSEDIKKLILKK